MNKTISIYLDFLRIVAAFGVVLVHANFGWFSDNKFPNNELGHKLVMVFFVLSGFLVAYTTHQKKKDLGTYLIDRGSRLYSVVIPALIFTYLVDGVGSYLNPTFYQGYVDASGQWWRAMLNVAFLQQHWHLCTKPSCNGAFWSIAYEFWYYVIFGIYVYMGNHGKRIWIILACILFVGIKITLLLPVWVMGVISYRLQNKYKLNQSAAIIGFGLSTLLILYFTFNDFGSPFEESFPLGLPPLYFSSRFPFDYWYGLLIAANIYFVTKISFKSLEQLSNDSYLVRIVKFLSSTTFTLYLFHLPLLLFAAATISYDHSSYLHLWLIIISVFIVTGLCSIYIEPTRKYYRQLFTYIFSKILTPVNQ